MSLFRTNRKSVILLFVSSVLVAVILSAVTVFSGTPVGRAGRPSSTSEIASYENEKSLKAYEKRNAEIDSWMTDDALPDCNNAAFLYYQALLLKPDYAQSDLNKIYDVYGGDEPDTQTRIFLGQWLPAMKMSEIASHIQGCTWGAWSEKQIDVHFLNAKLRPLCYVIAADAITLASDGHYKAALERCMTLRRIARHLSYDSKLHISSNPFDGMGLKAVCVILSDMPPDEDILTWLQGQLSDFHESTPFFERLLQESLKDMAQSSSITSLRDILLKTAADEQARQSIRALTDEQIRSRAIEVFQNFLDSVSETAGSDISYERKLVEIQNIFNKLSQKNIDNPLMNISDDMKKEIKSILDNEMTNEQRLVEIKKKIDESTDADSIEIWKLVSKQVRTMVAIEAMTKSGMTDEQRQAEVQKLSSEIKMTNSETEAMTALAFKGMEGVIERWFKSHIRHVAQVNSTEVAVEIYLIAAKTGKLPEKLPAHLPKDPYTSEAFEYESSDDGFVLRCRDEDKTEFKFNIQKQGK